VTRRTIDVEAFLAAQDIFLCDLNGNRFDVFAVNFAGVAGFIKVELAACYGIFNLRPFGAAIAEKVGSGVDFVARLCVHVIAAGA
jgi:hypothetical protein